MQVESAILPTRFIFKKGLYPSFYGQNANVERSALYKCDIDAEGQFANEFEDDAGRPKCDMEADETTGEIEIVNEAARPKCDMDEDETTDKEIEKDAVRPKSDLDAETFVDGAEDKQEKENGAAAAKTDT